MVANCFEGFSLNICISSAIALSGFLNWPISGEIALREQLWNQTERRYSFSVIWERGVESGYRYRKSWQSERNCLKWAAQDVGTVHG